MIFLPTTHKFVVPGVPKLRFGKQSIALTPQNLRPLRGGRPNLKIVILGLFLLLPYLAAWWLSDLRQNTVGFELVFFAAFALYAVAVVSLILRFDPLPQRGLWPIFALAVAMQSILIFTPPTLSDDMYRYVWEGRLQAHGFSPYRYPPRAPELTHLRDKAIWPHINRKNSITVYPPAAQMAYVTLWRIWPDSVRWFQLTIAASGLLAGVLLVKLLQALGRSPYRVLIYLWSPLLAFETAHAAHIDGLILPLLVGVWWARVKERDSLVGILLGLAAAIKFYPALLLPALWRPQYPHGRWRMPLAFALTLSATYLPYLLIYGSAVIGFLPKYLREQFNAGPLVNTLLSFFYQQGFNPTHNISILLLTILGLIALSMALRPARDGETALRRCLWLIGPVTLLSYNLFSWYLLWLLPLIAIFLQPGERFGLRLDAWTGWWLFSGLIALSYTFFLAWKPIPLAIWVQYIPLYLFLLIDLARRWKDFRLPLKRAEQRLIEFDNQIR